jgi:LDH2 family malate/lactate/ureidoglycolate dehydrogenase
MSTEASVVRVDAQELRDLAALALTGRGATLAHARIQADHLVAAELRGHPSHGLRRLDVLVARIEKGLIDPVSQPVPQWTAAAALTVDGARGFGPVVAYGAIAALRERLPETGVAIAALHRTHHLGILAPYVEQLAAAGLVGLMLSSTEGLVHPWGGVGALLGTNPIAIGVPASGGDLAVDMSTGAVSAGKILDYRAKGMTLPDGWAVDVAGHETTDAAAAAAGAISPFGGPKGYALGLAFGAIVGSLTGTALGPDVHGTLDTAAEVSKGDVIIAIDPVLFAGSDMRASLGDYFGLIRRSGADGSTVTVPGDRARANRDESLQNGVPLSTDVWSRLLELAEATDLTGVGSVRIGSEDRP